MVSEDSESSEKDSKTLERVLEWMERLGVVEKNGKGLGVPLHHPPSREWQPDATSIDDQKAM
jgi:hypothetical protein